MLFRFLILVHVCAAFPLKCPEPAQWSTRARGLCPDPSKYFCLKNDLINGYSENCTVFDFLQPGRKHVLRGGLDADVCSSERYQPWPITFYTNVSTNCIFLKSACNEVGQVVYGNGNRNTDVTCTCDYTNGYAFLVKPQNPCFCVPSEDDCSCYLKTCNNSTFKLSSDYECINSRMNLSMPKCKPIIKGRNNTDKTYSQTQYISRKDNISSPVRRKMFAGMSTLIVCIGLLLVLCAKKILDKYFCKAYFFLEPADEITIIEGQSVSLEYKLLINRFAITYARNSVSLGESGHISTEDTGRSKTLSFNPVALTDAGIYFMEAEGIKSKPTTLTVKPLFKQPLKVSRSVEGSETIFRCETEKKGKLVEWFKDDNMITDYTTDSVEGCILTYTIKCTEVKDTGKYRIQVNGISSTVDLKVKAMFQKPLENNTIVEGSDTVLRCKTEERGGYVEWLKDGKKINHEAKNITQQIISEQIYELKITSACLVDSGKYGILKNGICSEAYLKVKAMFKHPLENITIMEGLDVQLQCETEEENSSVKWCKDYHAINQDTKYRKIETLPGYIYRLKISPARLEDDGKYTIEKNKFKSSANLTITALFKRPLTKVTVVEGLDAQLKCETEEDSSSVEWFKDDVQITIDTENIKRETLPGHIYTLTFTPARIKDGGTYKIVKNGIRSEAVLDVTAFFKRPLTKVTIMEGLDAQIECETVDESSSIEWFKDNEQITLDTEKIKREALPLHVYRLTITPARIEDSGKYKIELNGFFSEAVLDVTEMPEAIKQMSDNDRQECLKATKSGTTKRYNVRVMIVGKGQVGKTSLLRRLMNEQLDDVTTTDGLEILRRRCQIDVSTGKWNLLTYFKDHHCIWSGTNEQIADCGFWDFAGQKDFYATHQTFLSSNAVYLLVVDISENITKQGCNDMIEKSYDSIGEYIEFWLDNIHCYCTDFHTASSQCKENMELNPPVIIVGTGIDKIPPLELQDKKQGFHEHIHEIISSNVKRKHLRNVHFLSNAFPSDKGMEFESLREDIFDKAKSLKTWGEVLPTRWIVLEKEIYKKITDKKYTMSYTEAIQLAIDCSFSDVKQTTSELNSFLKYEHEIGNIIFFEDVSDFIILDPKWLVDVFKCFVSHQYTDQLMKLQEWFELEKQGKLVDTLIVKLLEKVPHLTLEKHKDFVLQIMEKFYIIVKSINDTASEFFYMPCMIKSVTIDEIIENIGAEDWKKTSWFCLEFDFLPPSFFNHILVSFVKEMKLWTKKDNQLCLYRNIGLFDINAERTKVLTICLSQNTIAMQILQYRGEDCYSDFKEKLVNLVNAMIKRYRININYHKKFICSKGMYDKNKGKVNFDIILNAKEYNCMEHKKVHLTEDIFRSWLTDEEIEKEYNNLGYRKCHYCVNKCAYKCCSCSVLCCIDCSTQHKKENISLMPIMIQNRKHNNETNSLSTT